DLAAAADPDAALLSLVRLVDPSTTGVSGVGAAEHVAPVLRGGGEPRARLVRLLGGSGALADHLVRHPEHVDVVAEGRPPEPGAVVRAVEGLREREGADALRV